MLDGLPALWWNIFPSFLSEDEVRQLHYKLSHVSKSLYDISKTIKLHKKCSFFRKIYIPKSIPFNIIQSTILYFAKQYNSSQKWLVYIQCDTREYEISKMIIETSHIFNIAICSNGKLIENIEPLEIILSMAPERITSLDLHSAKLLNSHISILTPYLENLQQLTTLNLENNIFGFMGSLLLPQFLSKMPQLTSLNLASNSLDSTVLESCLHNLTQLQLLNLRNNNIRTSGMKLLVPIIAKLQLLETLDIGSNGIFTVGIRLLASIKLPKLKTLSLANNSLEKSGEQLSIYLDMMPQITSLNLSCNYITDFSKIIHCLEKMENLQSLNLSYNRIYTPVVVSIIETIAKLLHIKEVNLSSNFIGDDGAKTIISYLGMIPQLELLDLKDNLIHKKTKSILNQTIKSLGHNTTVYLGN